MSGPLRILATSREALRLDGEVVWRVPPLLVPGPQEAASDEELTRSEAVRLFLERARSRDVGFELSGRNAGAVAEVCRRLEGIPLAIELAAARAGVLSPEQMAARLDDSLGLLRGGGRTTEHRTLDWSYGHLSEPEKELFHRLSVFAGGWALEAAEAVGSEAGAGEVLDLLDLLVDKSLVVAEADKDAWRYRLLEPIRQYAWEHLEKSGEAEKTRRRHAEWYLALAEEAEERSNGPEQAGWMRRLEIEHDNLRAALHWSFDGGEAETGTRLAAALWLFWFTRGHSTEGRSWLEKALTNRQIAQELSISERTVTTHVGRSLKKLGLGSRARLAAWIAERRLPNLGGYQAK